jgi:hypothetical protein
MPVLRVRLGQSRSPDEGRPQALTKFRARVQKNGAANSLWQIVELKRVS